MGLMIQFSLTNNLVTAVTGLLGSHWSFVPQVELCISSSRLIQNGLILLIRYVHVVE